MSGESRHIVTDGYDVALTEYNGQPSNATAKLAFFNVGDNVTIELIEPDENRAFGVMT